jgi:hypothetical protein
MLWLLSAVQISMLKLDNARCPYSPCQASKTHTYCKCVQAPFVLLPPEVSFKHFISPTLICYSLNYCSSVCVVVLRWDLGLLTLHAVEIITHIGQIHEGEGEGEAAEWVGRLVLCT